MQASDDDAVGGAGENAPRPPASGAAPALGNGEGAPTAAVGAAPLTGGNGEALFAGVVA